MASKLRNRKRETVEVTSEADYNDYNSDRKQFSTGAVRSTEADDVRYDLISHIGLRRLAETYREGSLKYGDHNWLKGFPFSEVLNHAMKHIEQWRAGDTSEDHLAHAAWNLFALMHYESTLPALNDIPARQSNAEVSNGQAGKAK